MVAYPIPGIKGIACTLIIHHLRVVTEVCTILGIIKTIANRVHINYIMIYVFILMTPTNIKTKL